MLAVDIDNYYLPSHVLNARLVRLIIGVLVAAANDGYGRVLCRVRIAIENLLVFVQGRHSVFIDQLLHCKYGLVVNVLYPTPVIPAHPELAGMTGLHELLARLFVLLDIHIRVADATGVLYGYGLLSVIVVITAYPAR